MVRGCPFFFWDLSLFRDWHSPNPSLCSGIGIRRTPPFVQGLAFAEPPLFVQGLAFAEPLQAERRGFEPRIRF